jgi:hypothetical protein
MGKLVGVGGLHVPGAAVRELERSLDALCDEVGFPRAEEFKWSPKRGSWMRGHLEDSARENFFRRALGLAGDLGCRAIVVIEDCERRTALRESESPQEDVVTLLLERADNHLRSAGTEALILTDRPSGGRKSEVKFLSDCLELVRLGTPFVQFEHLALMLTGDSRLVRLLQLADVITSCTVAYVGGETPYSGRTFESVKPILRTDGGRVGGVGVKLHPDLRYGNLYHWLLGDDYYFKGHSGVPLPYSGWPYFSSADRP